jgi:hypothetical protein
MFHVHDDSFGVWHVLITFVDYVHDVSPYVHIVLVLMLKEQI